MVKKRDQESWRVVYWGINFGHDLASEQETEEISRDDFLKMQSMAREKLVSWLTGDEAAPTESFLSVFHFNYRFVDEDPMETILFRPAALKYSTSEISQELNRQYGKDLDEGEPYCIELDEGGWALYFTFFKDRESGEFYLIKNLWGNFSGS